MFGEEGELLQMLPILQSPALMMVACLVGFIVWSLAVLFPIFVVLKVTSLHPTVCHPLIYICRQTMLLIGVGQLFSFHYGLSM